MKTYTSNLAPLKKAATFVATIMLSCIMLVLVSPDTASSAVSFSETFENAAIDTVPSPWSLAGPVSGTTGKVVNGYSGNTTKVFRLTDLNANFLSNTLYTNFAQTNVGYCVLQFDVCFVNTNAGFGARITNGGSPVSTGNWGATIKFEGNAPYARNTTAGTLSYQQYAVLSTTDSFLSITPTVNYQANTWYTVKVIANIDTKMYQLYFGPCGGPLNKITPAAGVPFIKSSTGAQITTTGGVTFFTSQYVEPQGEMYIDNVHVTNGAILLNDIAEARQQPLDTMVELLNKVVTAGTDQMNKPFFYIQDGSGGIRVRTSVTVCQGDRVTLAGTIQRASDSGTAVARNGEREINARNLTVDYGPFPMPKPVGMTNRSIGGGPSATVDTDGYPCQPGVWAKGTGADSGYDQINEAGLNNVGRFGRFWGKVVYADDVNRFFYINDGSNVQDGGAVAGSSSPKGVRVLAPPGVPLTNIVGKYAIITGVVGSVSQADAGAPQGYVRNVRVIRPTCEPFLDLNSNGFHDAGEAFIDANENGIYEGINVGTMPAPNYNSVFDRYGTAICRQRPFMPRAIYIYWPDTPTLDEMVRQGFNTIVCFELQPGHLADINAHGLKTLPPLRVASSRPGWMAVKDDPAILGWYLHDEPEGQGCSVEQALIDFNWVKAQDPSHFIGESHFIYEAYANYAASEQFTLSDRYPVGNAPLSQVGDFISMIKSVHGSIYYPAWPFIQTFQEAPNFVMPSPEQVRAMTYQGLAHLTRGLFYFSYQRPDHPYWPLDWAEIKRINGEMDLLSPFLLMPWIPVDVTSSNPYVRAGGFRVGGSAIIFTVNVEGSNQATTITLPGIASESLTLPLENGATQPLTNRAFAYTYGPYQVRVLMWGDIPPAP